MQTNHRFAAVCGELAHRTGDAERAIAAFEAAVNLCPNDAERTHLQHRLAVAPDSAR